MENRRTLEFFFVAFLAGLGGPIFALLGAQDGDRMAAIAYPSAFHRKAEAAAPVDYKAAVLGGPAFVEKGKSLYATYCVACHGPDGDGKGAAAGSLTPMPRNFLDPDSKWTHGREPMEIFGSISKGSPGTSMMGFAASLSVEDRWALVHYLGTLAGVAGKFRPVEEGMAASWRPEGTP